MLTYTAPTPFQFAQQIFWDDRINSIFVADASGKLSVHHYLTVIITILSLSAFYFVVNTIFKEQNKNTGNCRYYLLRKTLQFFWQPISHSPFPHLNLYKIILCV